MPILLISLQDLSGDMTQVHPERLLSSLRDARQQQLQAMREEILFSSRMMF